MSERRKSSEVVATKVQFIVRYQQGMLRLYESCVHTKNADHATQCAEILANCIVTLAGVKASDIEIPTETMTEMANEFDRLIDKVVSLDESPA